MATGAALLLSAAGWAIVRSPLLNVDHIRLQGARVTRPVELKRALGVGRGRAMADVDIAASAHRIERLPWIATASVRRRWPGTILVTVTERRPAAIVRTGSGPGDPAEGPPTLVDGGGRVLGPANLWPGSATLPLVGPTTTVPAPGAEMAPSSLPALHVAEALGRFDPGGPVGDPVMAVVTDGSGSVDLRPRRGGLVRIGRPDDLLAKLAAARAVMLTVDLTSLGVLNVEDPTRPFLTTPSQ